MREEKIPDISQHFRECAEANTEWLRKQRERLRSELLLSIRRQVLLPFCRKHRLEFAASVYDDYFIDEAGETIDKHDLDSFGREGEIVLACLLIELGGDRIFDHDLPQHTNITADDLHTQGG